MVPSAGGYPLPSRLPLQCGLQSRRTRVSDPSTPWFFTCLASNGLPRSGRLESASGLICLLRACLPWPSAAGQWRTGPAPGTGGSLDSEGPDGGTSTPSHQEPGLCLTSAPGAARPVPAARGHSVHGPSVVPGPGVVLPHRWDLAGAGSPWCSLGMRVVGSG